jgi:plasmid segregation protein ParM
MSEILGVDAGNDRVKIFGPNGEMSFPSTLGEFRQRNLDSHFSKDDMIYEFNGKKGFAGTLAQYESEFATTRFGDTKAHEEFLIRVLLGLHRYSEGTDFKVVVGQPISMHTPTEKSKMKKMLEKTHAITVNGDYKQITILRAEVAAEGGAAFWSNPQKGKVRILDFGSGTVNAATLIEGRYIDRDSFTLKFGLNTIRSQDLTEMGRYVANECLKKWNEQDDVYCVGGGAELMIDHLHEYFPNVKPLQPKVGGGLNTKVLPPIFANAVGFYKIGNKVFQ